MVASPGVKALTDQVQAIQIVAEYLKNPKVLHQLKDEVLELNKLNQEEEARLHEARILLQSKLRLEAEIKSLEKQQSEMQDRFSQERLKADAELAEKIAKSESDNAKRTAELDAKEEEQNARDESLRQRDLKLKEKAALITGVLSQ